ATRGMNSQDFPSRASLCACPDCAIGGSRMRPPGSGNRVLELRPAQREPLWWSWARHPLAFAGAPALRARIVEAPTGSMLALMRDGARIVRGSLRRALEMRLFALVSKIFSLQRRIE